MTDRTTISALSDDLNLNTICFSCTNCCVCLYMSHVIKNLPLSHACFTVLSHLCHDRFLSSLDHYLFCPKRAQHMWWPLCFSLSILVLPASSDRVARLFTYLLTWAILTLGGQWGVEDIRPKCLSDFAWTSAVSIRQRHQYEITANLRHHNCILVSDHHCMGWTKYLGERVSFSFSCFLWFWIICTVVHISLFFFAKYRRMCSM